MSYDYQDLINRNNVEGVSKLGFKLGNKTGRVRGTFSVPAGTPVAPPVGTPALGTARSFATLGATAVTNTGNSVLTGNLGVFPGVSITGFPPGLASGTTELTTPAASAAQAAALAAYTDLQSRAAATIASALDGQTLTAGVYKFASGAATLAQGAPGTLTLNGSATDIFVIQTVSTLTTGAGGAATVALTGGALARNVYWVVGSSATINTTAGSVFRGNLIANTAITVGLGDVQGSLIALNAAVTFSAATTVEVQALPAAGGGLVVGAYGMGVTIPKGASVSRAVYKVLTSFESATDAATISLGLVTATDIVAATALSVGTVWDAAVPVNGAPVGATPSTWLTTTSDLTLTATVGVESLSQGKLVVFLDWFYWGDIPLT